MAFCSNCGHQLNEGVKFCDNCGAPVELPEVSINVVAEEKKVDKLRKYGRVLSIILLVLALVDYYSDPPFLTILLSLAIIGGVIYCVIQKYKGKFFSIIALLIAAFCLFAGISQAKEFGLFKVPKDSDYAEVYSELENSTVEESPQAEVAKTVEESETKLAKIEAETKETLTEIEAKTDEEIEKIEAESEKTLSEAEQEVEAVVDNSEEKDDTKASTGGVDPELKEFLDSYEAFMDEYVEFMKGYMDDPGNAITMLAEYAKIMEKYEEFSKAADAYDTKNMSVEDSKYYLEVLNRCNQKLLEVY